MWIAFISSWNKKITVQFSFKFFVSSRHIFTPRIFHLHGWRCFIVASTGIPGGMTDGRKNGVSCHRHGREGIEKRTRKKVQKRIKHTKKSSSFFPLLLPLVEWIIPWAELSWASDRGKQKWLAGWTDCQTNWRPRTTIITRQFSTTTTKQLGGLFSLSLSSCEEFASKKKEKGHARKGEGGEKKIWLTKEDGVGVGRRERKGGSTV